MCSELNCALCQDKYQNPKTLECLHSFCCECLELYVETNGGEGIQLSCPLCRTPVAFVSKTQVKWLQADPFLINSLKEDDFRGSPPLKSEKIMCEDQENEGVYYCLDCQLYLCDGCQRVHQRMRMSSHHKIIQSEELRKGDVLIMKPKIVYCETHPEKEIELYCKDCEEGLCCLCIDQHQTHPTCTLSNAFGNEKILIQEQMEKVKQKTGILKQGIQEIEKVVEALESNFIETQNEISYFFKKLRHLLDQKEAQFRNQAEEVLSVKKKELALQKEDLKFGIEWINGSCSIITNTLNEGNQLEILMSKRRYISRLMYLQNHEWKMEPIKSSIIGIQFSKNAETLISENILSCGLLFTDDLSLNHSYIQINNNLEKIVQGDNFSFDIHTHSREGPINCGGKNFQVIINGPSRSQAIITDNQNGIYSVSFSPHIIGSYSISVLYQNKHIQSSPFDIQVFSKTRKYSEGLEPKLKFGTKGNQDGNLDHPFSVCTNSKSQLIVGDCYNHRIQVFNKNGDFLFNFGSRGTGNGQLNYPCGLVTDSNDNIYVSDRNNHRIQIFDQHGKFLQKFGFQGTESGQFHYPKGIAIDSFDNIYVSDSLNNRVQIFDKNGNFLKKFGETGSANGQFNNPLGICVNSKGNIIVADNVNHRIQIFDSSANFIRKFGICGHREGELYEPCFIAVDLDDNILIAELSNNRIQVFDEHGEFISKFGSTQLLLPTGIAFDKKTMTVIVSEEKDQIFVY